MPAITSLGKGGLLYLVFKNNNLLCSFTKDNDLVCGFVQKYVIEEGLGAYNDIAKVFNDNTHIFVGFDSEIVSDNPTRWSKNHIQGAKSATGIDYYIQSGLWNKTRDKRLQKFCKIINKDKSVFADYSIYFCYPKKIMGNTII